VSETSGETLERFRNKKIFGATKRSEELMSYLDEKLYEKGIAIDCFNISRSNV
jgi:hypothetical protein